MLWDLTGFFWLNSYAGLNEKWDIFFIFISDKLLYVTFTLVFLLFLLWKKPLIYKIRIFWNFLLAVLLSYATVYLVFHQVWPRLRPFDSLIGVHQLVEESGFSFPSKHAVSAFVLATFVFFHNKRLSFLVFFFGILIALGRIFVGVHFPTDVIGSALLRIIIGILFGSRKPD
jgi:undecaprenyl-diphosphatase